MEPTIYPILALITSFIIVLVSTPAFIKVAVLKHLIDEPKEERKLHTRNVPSMGGVMIFSGTLFAFSLWYPSDITGHFNFIIPCMLILFFVGMKDDIIGTAPVKKLIAHLIVAFIMVLMADIRITSMHGLFGIREIPDWASIFLSVFTYIVIVNAFNLIDGVDGLAGGVGCIASVAFGIWFYFAEDLVFSVLAFALAGSLFAFLRFNFAPAKIFMGDSGSLTIGFIVSVLAIEMIEYDGAAIPHTIVRISKPILAMAILVYPLIDTLRIFIYRALKGTSPFSADKNHIHHRLLDIGLSHKQTVVVIYIFSMMIIGLTISLQRLEPSYNFIITVGATLLLIQIPFLIRKKQ